MKKHLLIFVFLSCLIQSVFAQTAANYYNAGKANADKAAAMLSKMSKFDKATNDNIIALYRSSADNYIKAKDAMSAIKYHADYCAAISLFHAATQLEAGGDPGKAYESMKQVLELWPSFNGIKASAITKEKSVSRGENVYIFPAADSMYSYTYNYYMTRYLLSILSLKQNMPDDALKYAEDVADHFQDDPEIIAAMAYFASSTLHKQGNTCDAGKYSVTYLENISQVNLKENDPTMADKNHKLLEMESYVVGSDSQGCIKNKTGEECVAVLADLKAPWKPNARGIYNLGDNLFVKGSHSFKLIFSEYKLAMTEGDSTVAHIWDARLDEYKRHFSSADWRTLASFYDNYLTKAALRDKAIKNAQRKQRAEATYTLIGIEPTVIPLGQYAAGIQVMGKYVSHEIRVGYIAAGIKPYLKSGSDTDKVALGILTHYSGIQLSYSFKVLTKGEFNPQAWSYIGAEFRYTMRNYTDLLTYYNIKDTAEQFHNINLKPQAAVYDATLIFGEIIRGKKLFFELFGGLGLGYKTLTYGNPVFNSATEAVANAPFKSDLWNKLYVPVRAGIKFGFVL